VLVALAFAAIYAAFGLVRHWHFESSAYDLGINDQIVWHLSRLEAPASTVHGLSNMFGDHFSPVWALLAPFYWVYPHPESLIVAQALLLGASVVPVWIFLERRLPKHAAALLSLAYGCFWGLQRAAQFDVHELVFAPVLIAIAVLAMDRSDWRWFLAAAALLCLVKEDQIPLVASFGGLWWLRATSRADRWRAVIVSLLAVALFGLVVGWVIPSLSDTGEYAVGSAYSGALAHPATIFVRLVSPPVKLQTVLMWLAPFVFLPMASPYGLLIVPLALERFLSTSPNHWGTSFHYSAPLAPILAMAAGDALAKYAGRSVTYLAALCLLLSAVLPGRQPMWKLLSPSFYRAPAFAETARRALTVIPAGASVVAQAAVVPHLTRRAEIYMLCAEGRNAGVDADYVIAAAEDLSPWPMAGAGDVSAQLAVYRGRGYQRVFEERSWIVLKRSSGAR
jgi:uncharacterized membrane protein